MPINVYLWKAALETIKFMPLNSTDPVGVQLLQTGIPQLKIIKNAVSLIFISLVKA